ncbi:MAG: hypothetical protein KIC73_01205 [Clostridiales bacterium]|jgi:hypothetical protein|nr:hypothetical protein [Clostridiales bacterium]
MKVKNVLKKFMPARSNCAVFIQDGLFGDLTELSKDDLKNLTTDFIMDLSVSSLTVIDNVFTVHVNIKN